jgi:hypothetical protein
MNGVTIGTRRCMPVCAHLHVLTRVFDVKVLPLLLICLYTVPVEILMIVYESV